MADAGEIEWQFDALDLGAVAQWLEDPAEWRDVVWVVPRGSTSHVDVYLDTEDRRFHRAGYSLRIRTPMEDGAASAEATLKALDSHAAPKSAPRERREISEEIEQAELASLPLAPGPVGERVRTVAGKKPLLALFEVLTGRRVFALEVEGVAPAELALDEATIRPPDNAPPTRLQRVEIELSGPAVAPFEAFVERLRAACNLHPAVLSKYETGLLSTDRGSTRPAAFAAMEIGPDAALADVAISVLRRHLFELVEKEPSARLGDDAEALHDMRVAGRRVRAALSFFADVLPKDAPILRAQLGSVSQALGAVRDLDVQIQQLDAWVVELPKTDREPLAQLRSLLGEKRAEVRKSMLAALDSAEYEALVAGLESLVRNGSRRVSFVAARAVAPDLLEARFRKLRARGDRIGPDSDPADFHRVRIEGKRFRYALEFLADVYPGQTRRLIKRTVAMQDVLGRHQDAETAIARLRHLATERADGLEPATIFAMGEMTERYRQDMARLRTRFPAAYARVRKRWKSLRKLLEEQRPVTADAKGSQKAA